MKFQKFRSIKSVNVRFSNLIEEEEVYNQIRTGGAHKHLVMEAREIGKDNPGYKEVKLNIPKVHWNAMFTNRVNFGNIVRMTNYVYCDIDYVEDIPAMKEKLKKFPFIRSIWVSCGGNGIGFLVKCDSVTKNTFKAIYNAIESKIDMRLDQKSNKITQGNILSYDPEIYYNPNSTLFTISDFDLNLFRSMKGNKNSKSKKKDYDNVITLKYLNQDYTNNIIYISNFNNIKTTWDLNVVLPPSRKFKTTFSDDFFGSDGYRIIPEGYDYVEAYMPAKGVYKGERTVSLFSFIPKFIHLNPEFTYDDIKSCVTEINDNCFYPPLEDGEVDEVLKYCWDKYLSGELFAKAERRYIAFRDSPTLKKSEKLQICGCLSGQMRRDKRLESIITGIDHMIHENLKITQESLSKVVGVSTRTVQRYWAKITVMVETSNTKILHDLSKSTKASDNDKNEPQDVLTNEVATSSIDMEEYRKFYSGEDYYYDDDSMGYFEPDDDKKDFWYGVSQEPIMRNKMCMANFGNLK